MPTACTLAGLPSVTSRSRRPSPLALSPTSPNAGLEQETQPVSVRSTPGKRCYGPATAENSTIDGTSGATAAEGPLATAASSWEAEFSVGTTPKQKTGTTDTLTPTAPAAVAFPWTKGAPTKGRISTSSQFQHRNPFRGTAGLLGRRDFGSAWHQAQHWVPC